MMSFNIAINYEVEQKGMTFLEHSYEAGRV